MQKIAWVIWMASLLCPACDCGADGSGIVIDAATQKPIDSVLITRLFDGKTELEAYHVDIQRYTNEAGRFEESFHYGCGFNGPIVALKFEKNGYKEAIVALPRSRSLDTLLKLERTREESKEGFSPDK